MSEETTGGNLVVATLREHGVSTVFGVPGDTGVDLYDALAGQSDINHVLARDERHAASMADVYARCTNRVGVVEVSSGGGVTFVVGGLGEPYAASTPMLIITSDIHTGSRNTGALTEIDQELLFSAVTKWSTTVTSAREIPDAIIAGMRQATSGRPAPVVVIIPEDVLAEKVDTIGKASPLETTDEPVISASADQVRRCAEALRNADQPALVVGGGIHTGAAWSPLRRVIDGFGVPVATSIQGKGAYPETGPWALGVAGANGARDYANEYLATADVVLLVGTRANSTDTNGYLSPPREAEVYQIDIDAARAGRNYPGATPLVGDASVLLTALADLAPAELPARCAESLDGIQTERSNWNAQMEARIGTFGTGVLSSYAVFRAVRQQYRDADVRVVSDCGTPTPYLGAVWETEIAERSVILARGHGPMGFAIPGAVGAAIANPDREIVCFTTDGSFAMSCGELETAARLSLPIRFIHLSNQSLGWIKMLQHLYFGQRYHGVEGSAADPVPVAMGFGVPAIRAHTLLDLQDALDKDRSSQGPTFIDVHVPDQTVEVPPVAPWQAALLGDSQRPVY